MSKIWMGIGFYIELFFVLLDKNLFIKNYSSLIFLDIFEMNYYIFWVVCLSFSYNIIFKKMFIYWYLFLCLSIKVDIDSYSMYMVMFK